MNPAYTPSPGYGRLLPSTTAPLHPTSFEGWFFTFWAGGLVVLLALPWAIWCWGKRRDVLPLLMLAAGAITSLGEPQLDLVSHLRWANNLPGPAFTNFGLHVPALIPPCYMLFMGLEAYWIYTVLQRGTTKTKFFWMAAGVGISDAIMENPGLLMHAYQYYGNQPFKFGDFPYYYAFTNSVAICTIAVLLYYLWPLVKDRGWLKLSVLAIGIIGTTTGEFGAGFPVFLAINANMATWLQWVIGSGALILSVLWIRVLAEFVAKQTVVDYTLWGLFKSRFSFASHRADSVPTGVGAPGLAQSTVVNARN